MDLNEYGKIISKNLKRIMYERNKTQADVARDLGISKATISSWMLGTRIPRMNKIDLLCDYFNVRREDLMEDRPETYYIEEDARELAEFMFRNPEYKVLFNASRNVKKEDIEFVANLLERFKNDTDDIV